MRKHLDLKAKLSVHRTFVWLGSELPAGAEFPIDRATPEQIAELYKEGYLSHDEYTGLEGLEALEPGTARSPTPVAAKTLTASDTKLDTETEVLPAKVEARRVKATGPKAADQSETTLTAAKVKAKAAKAASASSKK